MEMKDIRAAQLQVDQYGGKSWVYCVITTHGYAWALHRCAGPADIIYVPRLGSKRRWFRFGVEHEI